jgi:hypothetical protein
MVTYKRCKYIGSWIKEPVKLQARKCSKPICWVLDQIQSLLACSCFRSIYYYGRKLLCHSLHPLFLPSTIAAS